MKIGVFDSGLGGFSIFREFLRKLPEYDYLYLADNARVPYGGRSPELIYDFTKRAVDFLFRKDCSLVILACNAASTNALRQLQQDYLPEKYPFRRILGVVIPVVEEAGKMKLKRIGVLATRATVSSQSYPKEIAKVLPYAKVYQEACPLLVPIIEENEMKWKGLDLILVKYLKPLLKKNVDSLILGCTHYGLITRQIEKHLPAKVRVISQGKVTAERLTDYLFRHPEIEKKLSKKKKREYFVTDLTDRFLEMSQIFLGENLPKKSAVQLVTI